jgi:hypothetical protein
MLSTILGVRPTSVVAARGGLEGYDQIADHHPDARVGGR